jgi:starch phosphorylase
VAEVHDGATLRAALLEIASDFSFTWIAETRLLFDALEPRRFAELQHNPTALLSELTDRDLARALTPDYLERLARVQGRLARDRGEETWWRSRQGPSDLLVAYFSAEFGLDESLPIYSGGLGVLAGDYLKAASELGIPLVGIGLFYRRGYFQQQLDENDRQIEHYPPTDTSRLPLELVPMAPVVELADDSGELVPVRLGVWRVRVGRASLYLIDTLVGGNPDWAVTETLYGGDRANRLRQEILLGVGGVRVLRGLGLEPTVFHLNEGHSAFLQLERMRELVEEQGLSADEALERLRASTVFTTHTPVPAGNEVFDPELVRRALGGLVERCGLGWEEFVALGKSGPGENGFGLTPFALRTSQYANAVSELHGAVSREMWHGLWPEQRVDQVPITSVTNGVHQRTWISGELEVLLGDTDPQFERARDLSAEDLWAARRSAKERLLRFVVTTRGVRELDPDVLTIGFARRFATYKRASLLFSRPERLAQLLADPERPIQVLVAGKAHPADEEGKDLIQLVVDFAREPTAAGPRRLPRGLRDDPRPAARAGRRHVAQHATAAVRGVGHVGDEGGAERRAQLLDPRRLVGRGVLPGRRVRDREFRGCDRGGAGRSGRGGALRGTRAAGAPGVLRARRGRAAAALDRAHAGVDRRARAALRHGADGGGVRRAALSARARRRDAARKPRRVRAAETPRPRGAPPLRGR